VIGVEPATANDTALSLRSGNRQTIAAPDTIADGLRHTTPAALPWTINQRLLDDIVTVTDHDIAAAVGLCFTWLKTVVEPSGAVALAAVAAGHVQPGYGRIAVVLSGGNADWATLHTLLGPDLT
jgi:threonine dehydratase